MKKLYYLLLTVLFLSSCSFSKEKTEINVIYPAFHAKYLNEAAKKFEALSGYKVNIHYFTYDEQHAEIMKSIKSDTALYDVFSMDLIWTAEFAKNNYAYDLSNEINPLSSDLPQSLLDAFTVGGKIYAMPFLVDFQIFFYNKEMIAKAGFTGPPKTLEEMLEQMRTIKKMGIVEFPWYDAWNQNESLICEYTWLTAAYGGKMFSKDGEPIFNIGAGVDALKFMKLLIDEKLVSPLALNSIEYMVRKSFIKGLCAFNTNWENQHTEMLDPTISDVVDSAGMGLIPVSEKALGKYPDDTVSVSGFEGLAILSNSKVKKEAWEFIKYLSSPEIQPRGFDMMPIWKSVQKDPKYLEHDPLLPLKAKQIASVHHRPMVDRYTEISAIMQIYIHKALKNELSVQDALDKAVEEIKDIRKNR